MPRERLNPPAPAAGHEHALDRLVPERTPEGRINNCAKANGDAEANCQVCGGSCFERFAPDQPPPSGHPLSRVRSMRVMWGDETIQPVQYNVFHTGTVEMEVMLRPGDDPAQVHAMVYEELERLGAEQYRLKRDAFLARLADTAQTVRARAKNPTR